MIKGEQLDPFADFFQKKNQAKPKIRHTRKFQSTVNLWLTQNIFG